MPGDEIRPLALGADYRNGSLYDPSLRAVVPSLVYSPSASAAYENFECYTEYRQAYSGYRRDMEDDYVFARLAQQWTPAEEAELATKRQAPLVFNHTRRILEQLAALIAGKLARMTVLPRVAATRDGADVLADILAYIMDISHGRVLSKTVVMERIARGSANVFVYVDPNTDYGRGDVMVGLAHALETYWDPALRDPLGETAEAVILSGLRNKSAVAQSHPEHREAIERAAPDSSDEDWQSTSRGSSQGQRSYAYGDRVKRTREQVRVIDRYTRILQRHLMIEDPLSGEAMAILPETEESKAREMAARWDAVIRAEFPSSAGVEVPIRRVNIWRIRQVTSITTGTSTGRAKTYPGLVLEDRVLPLSRYPVVPFFNIFTGNPFAQSEVRDLKLPQEFINKMTSLLVKSATGIASGGKIFVSEESQAYEEMVAKANEPNAVILTQGKVQDGIYIANPPPLPDLLPLVLSGQRFMDSVSGMAAELQGSGGSDRESARLRAIRNDEASRRPDQHRDSIEDSWGVVGEVAIEYAQAFYTGPKVFWISDTAGERQQMAINQAGQNGMKAHQTFDGRTLYGSINMGRYGVVVAPGSTKPTNRTERLEEAVTLRTADVVDREAVLEAWDAPQAPKILARMAEREQLVGQLQSLKKQLEESERRRVIAETETDRARRAGELEQFRGDIETKLAQLDGKFQTMASRVQAGAVQAQAQIHVAQREAELAIREGAKAAAAAEGKKE